MNDLKEMSYFFGIEIKQTSKRIFFSQRKYTSEILKKFRIENSKFMSTPTVQGENLKKEDGSSPFDATIYRSLVWCLLYLCGTRPDIMFPLMCCKDLCILLQNCISKLLKRF